MILRRIYDEKLAQASYLVGCAATGEALIVDPHRDVDTYIAAANSEGLRITHVTETHIHADFVSGARELAHRTGARLYLSDEGGPDWKYAFAEEVDAVLLKDGDSFMVGNVRVDVRHTPGHTPEHLTFLITDTAGADQPMGAMTGDFIFVGDVGRPDLLERAAGVAGTMVAGARQLFHSIQAFKELPDYLQIWPGHGAGSACGKALGAVPQSTLGYEKLFNWGLSHDDEDAFVDAVLAGQPDPPGYFAEMKRINKVGPPILGGIHPPSRQDPATLADRLSEGARVLDLRRASAYAAGHVPGTISLPLTRSFTTYAGTILSYDEDLYLLVDDEQCPNCVDEAVRDLAMIGLDRVVGWFGRDALDAWVASGRPLGSIEQIDADALAERVAAGDVVVLDVRGQDEWDTGHIPGALHIPLGRLASRLEEVPRDRVVVTHCRTGGRSGIAASLLRANGIEHVVNHAGGIVDWRARHHPVELESGAGVA